MITTLIPIGFMLIIALGIVYIQKKKYLSNRNVITLFIGGYIAILLLSLILSTFIPFKDTPIIERINEKWLNKQENELLNKAYQGKIDDINPNLIVQKWEKDYHYKELKFAVQSEDFLDTTIVVERKPTDDGKIEGILFKTNSIINGIDVTNIIQPVHLGWLNDQLTFSQPEPFYLDYTLYDKEFTVKQFTGEFSLMDGDANTYLGTQLLYLRIPKSLDIVYEDEINIEYVGQ